MGAFHAYDIRGVYNVDFDKHTAYKVGYFLPTFVCMNIENSGVPDGIVTNGVVSTYSFLPALGAMVLETAIVFICGMIYFRKTDLK